MSSRVYTRGRTIELEASDERLKNITIGLHSCLCLMRMLHELHVRTSKVGSAREWLAYTRRYLDEQHQQHP